MTEASIPKVLFLGETGSGKSALCNALAHPVSSLQSRNRIDKKPFPETALSQDNIGNDEVVMKKVRLLGGRDPVTFIDTVGFNSSEISNAAVANMLVSLKYDCKSVNLFVIVVKAPVTRMDAALVECIEMFESLFGKDNFWSNVVVIFTCLQQSREQIERRKAFIPDDKSETEFSHLLKSKFKRRESVPVIILDSHYDGDKDDERKSFIAEAGNLFRMLQSTKDKAVSLEDLSPVLDKYDGLKEEYEKKLREKEEELKNAKIRAKEFKKAAAKIGVAAIAGTAVVGTFVAAVALRNPKATAISVPVILKGAEVALKKLGDIDFSDDEN